MFIARTRGVNTYVPTDLLAKHVLVSMDSGESNDYTDQRRPAFSMMNSLRTVTGLIRLSNRMPKGAKAQNNKQQVAQRKPTSSGQTASGGLRKAAAAQIYRLPSIGLPSRLRATIGFVTGTVFVGNGTNGVANSVYFRVATGLNLAGDAAAGSAARCWMPAAPCDNNLGQTYMQDIMKHYTRLIIHKARVCLVSLHPSTANDCSVQLVVARGAGPAQQGKIQALATAGAVAAATADVLPMPERSRITCASYESKDLDVTSFIAGGSGAKQNEFEINADSGATAVHSATNTVTAMDLEGIVPFSFLIGGTNSTAGLQNTNVHDVVIEYDMELLDFIGGMNLLAPVGVGETAPSAPARRR